MEKEIVSRNYNGRDYTLEYSDGTVLNHTETAGIVGISDDRIVETLTYPDGSHDVSEYTTHGTRSLFGVDPNQGQLNNRDPLTAVRTYKDGTKEVITYQYNGDTQVATKDVYDNSGKIVSNEVTNRAKNNSYRHYYDDSPFLGYDDSEKEIKNYDDAGNVVSTKKYDGSGNIVSNEVAREMTFGGKVYTFNASELTAIIKSLDGSKTELMNILNNLQNRCNNIASNVSSADSNLSSLINKVGQLCNTCRGLIEKLLTGLSTDINTYISKTIANEETEVSNLNEIDSTLDDIANIYNSIS